jgi:hypothetical protein
VIALLLKDLKASQLPLAAIFVLYVLTSVTAARADEALFWLSIAFTAGLWVVPAVVDWQADADRFICSLPVARATIVRARSAWMLCAAAAGAAAWAAAGHLWRIVAPELDRAPGTPMWQSVEGILAFAAVAAVLAALFLPCYSRFGIGKGSAVFGFLTLAIVAVVAGLTAAGAIEPFGEADRSGVGTRLPAAVISHAFACVRDAVGLSGAVGFLCAGAAIINWAAVRMAAGFYEQREF